MCGIAGVITADPDAARDALPRMVGALAHRGPDDDGLDVIPAGAGGGAGGCVALGHRRLSVIDLSRAAHQPIAHPVTGDRLVYNGEIYNFRALRAELEAAGERFAGHGDTEVLLHGLTCWGPAECLRRLQGMFAFAFYRRADRSVVLARDPLGIKPLYAARVDGRNGLVFASEVRAVLASGLVPRRLNVRAAASMLAYGAVQQPDAIAEGVRAFPPGCYQVFPAGGAAPDAPVRYWDYPAPRAGATEPDAVAGVAATLEAAVADHLVADVPVGVFLSSGIDSTVVAGLAARHTRHLRSFTVGFADDPDLSELELAGETARLFGLDHTEVRVSADDALGEAQQWLAATDQPSMDGLNVFVISRAVRARGIKVALSGQGGDELFGGYPSFADVPRLHRLMRRAAWLPAPLRAAAARLYPGSATARRKLVDVARSDGGLLPLYLHRRRAASDRQLRAMGLPADALGLTRDYQPPEALAGVRADDADPVRTVSQLESRFYLGNMLLPDGDACAMAHGLEVRVPMLDRRLLDLVHAIPGRVRLPAGRADKHLLRAAFAPLLRPAVAGQAKRGFTLPLRRWMLGPLRPLCERAIADLSDGGVVRADGARAVWRAFTSDPGSPAWSRALALCVLGHYVARHGLTR